MFEPTTTRIESFLSAQILVKVNQKAFDKKEYQKYKSKLGTWKILIFLFPKVSRIGNFLIE